MSDLATKRDEIAGWISRDRGLGDLASLTSDQRQAVDRVMAEALEGRGHSHPELQRLIDAYRDFEQRVADEANAVLAEKGEVFAPEDDA